MVARGGSHGCVGRDGGVGAVFAGSNVHRDLGRCGRDASWGSAACGSCQERPSDPGLVYVFDGSIEGLLSAIFTAYSKHENPSSILPASGAQVGLFQKIREVSTDEEYAGRVHGGIVEQLGVETFRDVVRVFLADDPDRCTVAYRFVRYGLRKGSVIRDELSHEDVAPFAKISCRVANEREKYVQFLRFEEIPGGAFVAQIHPRSCVIPLVMGHFAARMGPLPFVIYDATHHLAGRWDGKSSVLCPLDGPLPAQRAEGEATYQAMWREFYHAIENQQRHNPRLRRQLMPKRYWADLTEIQGSNLTG
jgi:probable DNA metabolism protein